MVVTLPTVRPTTSSMGPASTAVKSATSAVEASAAESSEAAPGATHHGSGMETASCRSRSLIDTVAVTAPCYVV